VLRPHVLINALALGERLRTLPANVRLAARAGHMIAPRYSLDARLATWASLDIVVVHPFLE